MKFAKQLNAALDLQRNPASALNPLRRQIPGASLADLVAVWFAWAEEGWLADAVEKFHANQRGAVEGVFEDALQSIDAKLKSSDREAGVIRTADFESVLVLSRAGDVERPGYDRMAAAVVDSSPRGCWVREMLPAGAWYTPSGRNLIVLGPVDRAGLPHPFYSAERSASWTSSFARYDAEKKRQQAATEAARRREHISQAEREPETLAFRNRELRSQVDELTRRLDAEAAGRRELERRLAAIEGV